MAFVPIANACAAEVRFTYLGVQCEYTLGFYKSTGISVPDMTTLANLLNEWWYVNLRSVHAPNVTNREVYVRDLTTEFSPGYTSTTRAGTVGTLVHGSYVPANVAYCISFRTGLRGRANRGRNYVFGMGVNQLSAGTSFTSAYQNAVLAAWQTLLPGGSKDPTPFRWVVLSRQLDHVVQGRAVPITAVVAADGAVDSMRRRLPGRGS